MTLAESYYKYNHGIKGMLRKKNYAKTIKGKIAQSKYDKSHMGKKRHKKHYQYNKDYYTKKTNKRNRKLGFNIIIPNPYINTNIEFDWHHVNDNDVIAIPRNIHRSMYGNHHRENINEWIEIYYDIK